MSLPKKLLDAVKQDKEMLKLKFEQLKESLSKNLFEVKKAVEEGPKKEDAKEETAFSSIINQGKLAEEQVKIDVVVKTLQEQLITTSSSTSIEQKAAIQEQIELLKGDKLNSLEAKREAREMAEKSVDALESIAKGQSDLIKEFKDGFSELRGEGLGGLIKMIIVGIPAMLAGFTVGVVKPLMTFLSQFKSLASIFGKTGSSFNKIVRNLRAMFSAKGSVGKIFVGFIKTIKAFAAKGGTIGKLVGNLLNYVGVAFKFGSGLAKLAGPIGIAISIITGLIGGIKGAIKGFKEDGIIGMVREGIIGVFNGLIGGLLKMVGSMIGGIFKLLGFEKIGETIKGGFADFIDGIVGAFRGLANMIGGIFTLNVDMLKEGFGQLLDGILNFVVGIVKGIGGIIVGALAAILKGVIAIFVKLPIKIIAFMAKTWKFIYFDLPVMAFKLILKAVKFLLIDLPIKLIAFMAKAWKFIYFDLPVMAFKLIFKALKFLLLDIPLKLVGFAGTLLKAIFFDLPLMAFKMIFDGIKFLFIGLPGLLIDKVKTFFTSMVESIGDAFKTAFGFVKRIGKASGAALKAAMPGGESPKEAFMRVMGGDKGGEEKEEKENTEKIEKSAEKTVETEEQFIPKIEPKQKETAEEFEARMMSTVNGDIAPQAVAAAPQAVDAQTPALGTISVTDTGVQSFSSEGLSSDDDSESAPTNEGSTLIDKLNGIKEMMLGIISAPFTLLKKIHSTIFGVVRSVIKGVMGLVGTILGFIEKLGKAGIAAVKAIMPGGDSPAEAFMKVLTDEGEPKKGKMKGEEAEGMTPVLSSETPEEEPLSERDALGRKKPESLESALAYSGSAAGMLDPRGAARRVENAGPSVLSPAASIAAGPEETKVPKKLSFMDVIKKAGNFAKKAASFTPVGLLFEGISKVKSLMSSEGDSPLQNIIDNLPKEAREQILQGVSASNLVSSEERETIIEKLARSQSSTGRIGALKKFDLAASGQIAKDKLSPISRAASGQIAKDKLSPISSTGGAQLTMAQKENAELKGEVNTGAGAAIIAPSSINNSQSSVSNVTVAAPAHLDKTQALFGTTQLAY
jgi:hypothetical protein